MFLDFKATGVDISFNCRPTPFEQEGPELPINFVSLAGADSGEDSASAARATACRPSGCGVGPDCTQVEEVSGVVGD